MSLGSCGMPPPPVWRMHQTSGNLGSKQVSLRAETCRHGRGRDEDFSSPPAQIPACAANAPGSSLGSVVVMMSDLGRSSSDAQPLFGSTRYFGSVSEPRAPNGCSPWVG